MQDIIVVFVNPQILVNELLWLLAEVFRDPFYIGNRKKRASGFATIGTFQTVGFLEFAIVQFLHHIIDIFWRLLFQLIKILFVFDMLIFGKLWKIFYNLLQGDFNLTAKLNFLILNVELQMLNFEF